MMYNQYNQQLPMQQNQYSSRSNGSIIWVQGNEGAKAFQMYPNTNAILMDSESNNTFYIKECDSIGRCSLHIFNYSEVTDQLNKPNIDMSQYVTKPELEKLLNEMLGGQRNE